MNKYILTSVGTAVFAVASPSSAAVLLCSGVNCVTTDENVLVNSQTNTMIGQTLTGTTNNTNVAVTFSSALDVLRGNANGQAEVSSVDGLLNSLTFSLATGFGFTSAEFNLFPLPGNQTNEATEVIINYFTPLLGQQSRSINTMGQNFIGITGDAGEVFLSVGFVGNPASTGIQDMRQLRLGGVRQITAVPEPGTWAMLILGFGLVGGALRAARKQRPALNYI